MSYLTLKSKKLFSASRCVLRIKISSPQKELFINVNYCKKNCKTSSQNLQ